MSFSQRPWVERYALLGDQAEAEFESRYKHGFERAGHKRPKFRLRDVHPYEAQRPDYIVSGRYIEVMGMGEDGILKLKVRKLEALHFWRLLMPVSLWVWDSHKKRYAELPLEQVDSLAANAKIAFFPEGTPYYELRAEDIFEKEAA